MDQLHIPVLADEIKNLCAGQSFERMLDCTGGRGGHAAILLVSLHSSGCLDICDRDPEAVSYLRKRFAKEISSGRVNVFHAPFSKLTETFGSEDKFDFILADLGVSSPQLDESERGFSFRAPGGPLDMRMDPSDQNTKTAAELVNHATEGELLHILRTYGEEQLAAKIVRAIVKRRDQAPFTRTDELAAVVSQAVPKKLVGKIHPATKTFQALRMAVNQECEELATLLRFAWGALRERGLLAVISFHSIEDRAVKQFMNDLAKPAPLPRHLRDLPMLMDDSQEKVLAAQLLKPFPITTSANEEQSNPRARSAKMRIIRKNPI